MLSFKLIYHFASPAAMKRSPCCSMALPEIGSVQFSSVTQLCLTLRPHELQHTRPPCPSPTPRVHPNSCPLSQWCHPTISSSVVPLPCCPQSFPASGSFQVSQLFTSGGQSIGVSASTSVFPMNTQDWSPLGWTGITIFFHFIHHNMCVVVSYYLKLKFLKDKWCAHFYICI